MVWAFAAIHLGGAIGKGIVRGQSENTNLRVHGHARNNVIHAETIRTSRSESFFGKEYLNVVEALNDGKANVQKAIFADVDARSPKNRKVTIRDVALLYGQRPKQADVWFLSPYEFVMYWTPMLAKYPLSLKAGADSDCHCKLTDSGKGKLREGIQELIPGKDYHVKDGGAAVCGSLL